MKWTHRTTLWDERTIPWYADKDIWEVSDKKAQELGTRLHYSAKVNGVWFFGMRFNKWYRSDDLDDLRRQVQSVQNEEENQDEAEVVKIQAQPEKFHKRIWQ